MYVSPQVLQENKRFSRVSNVGLLIFHALALIWILIPIYMGRIPSMPRKSGEGWTPIIDMHTNPAKFWHYVISSAMIWPILFSMYLLVTARKDEHLRGLIAFSLLLGSVAIAFSL
jgi:hypothetical protein